MSVCIAHSCPHIWPIYTRMHVPQYTAYDCACMANSCPHIWPTYARMYGPLLPLYMAYICPIIWPMNARMYGPFHVWPITRSPK